MNEKRQFVLLAVVAAGVVALLILGQSGHPQQVLATGIAFCLVFTAGMAFHRKQRRAIKRAALAIEEDPGLSYLRKAPGRWHRPLLPLGDLPKSGDVHHLISGTRHGYQVTAFQHSYVISTGYSVAAIARTVVMAATPQWPRVVIKPRNLAHWALDRLGLGRSLELENERMQRRFRIVTDTPEFAELLLTPELQSFIADKPGVTWDLGAGRLALMYRGSMRFNQLEASFDRISHFLDLVPDELTFYE